MKTEFKNDNNDTKIANGDEKGPLNWRTEHGRRGSRRWNNTPGGTGPNNNIAKYPTRKIARQPSI
jgi:hypothetical protein